MSDDRKVKIIERLTVARTRLLETCRTLDAQSWTHPVYQHDDEDKRWTAADLLRHLTDAEQGMTRWIQNVLGGGYGVPEDFDLDRWNKSRVGKRKKQPPAQLMLEMDDNRQTLLALIHDLGDAELEKEGRHASLRIMNVEAVLFQIADHENHHMADLRAALGLEAL